MKVCYKGDFPWCAFLALDVVHKKALREEQDLQEPVLTTDSGLALSKSIKN